MSWIGADFFFFNGKIPDIKIRNWNFSEKKLILL